MNYEVYCTSVPCLYPGAGAGEGDSYQRVHVDDGPPVVGSVDHLVHQTVRLPLHFCIHYGTFAQGQSTARICM